MTKKKISLKGKIPKAFRGAYRAIRSAQHLYYVFKGGRSSGKSSVISLIFILLIIRFPVNGLCVRKVKDTLADSMYEQLKWAIETLEVESSFKITISPMRITYTPRGNYILFRGADDPNKIKSIKSKKYPFAILWVEELAEFKSEQDISTIVKSIVRAALPEGLKYYVFYSYNPPKRKQSWVNKKFETKSMIQPNTYIHHSTYLDNPYISEAFVEEAEWTKENAPNVYRHEYKGEPIGSGVVPFSNLRIERIPDDVFSTFDNIRQGNDWGYATDPNAFVRWHYDSKRRIIYAMNEIYGVKMANRTLAETMIKNDFHLFDTTADSAEPKSIAELKEHGVKRIVGAKKGPGSKEYGEKWLDELEAIVIDPKRTPNIAKEFENIDYETDKDGNVRPRLEDKDNHAIDATRYALERDMTKKTFGATSRV